MKTTLEKSTKRLCLKSSMNTRRGSILILALWALALLASFSVSLSYGVRQKAALLNRIGALDSLHSIAIAGVEAGRGLAKLDDATPEFDCLSDDWAQKSSLFKEITLGENGYFSVGYSITSAETKETTQIYGLVDEQSKINLNTSDVTTISRLLQFVGELDKDTAEDIAYCIVDWRDSDSTFQHPNYGAEDDYYSHLQAPYAAKNAPFQVIDELLLVKGINRIIFDKIDMVLTPFGAGDVNINTVSKPVLMALGPEERLVDKILSYRNGIDRDARTGDDRVFTQISSVITEMSKVVAIDDVEKASFENLISTGKLGTTSSFFMIRSKGVLRGNGVSLEMESVVDRNGKMYYLRTSDIQWPSKA